MIELNQLFLIARRWAWLITLGLIAGLLAGYYISGLQEPTYAASTRILVSNELQGKNSDFAGLTDQQLVLTYVDMLKTKQLRDAASEKIGNVINSDQLNIQQIPDTTIIKIQAESNDPEIAAKIANTMAQTLIETAKTLQIEQFLVVEDSLTKRIEQTQSQITKLQKEYDQAYQQIYGDIYQYQLAQVDKQIADIQSELSTLEKEIAALTNVWTQEGRAQLAGKENRVAQLQSSFKIYDELRSNLIISGKPTQGGGVNDLRLQQMKSSIDLYQKTYLELLSNLETTRSRRLQYTPSAVQVEEAFVPIKPVRPVPLVYILLAGFVGFTLGCGAAYILEIYDKTIKTTSDVERIFNLPVIGYISEIKEDNKAVVVTRNPNSILVENFRLLSSNIEFFKISNPIKTILVTSPSQGNGKTTIAANLALSIAQSEQAVLLVDADLRRSAVHAALKMTKEPGLSNILKSRAEILGVVRQPKGLDINVITAGTIPPNVTDVVGSKRISSILSRLKDNYETIIVDAPPLIISDSYTLASKVDGVILVIVPGETTIDQAKAIKAQLDRAEANVLGIVFNKLSARTSRRYGDYQYQALYSPRYYGDYLSRKPSYEEKEPAIRSNKRTAFFERGEALPGVAIEVDNAITAIKTKSRNLISSWRKTQEKR